VILGCLGHGYGCITSYPHPHCANLIPWMAEGLVLPYLDYFRFSTHIPMVLKRMARPAAAAKNAWMKSPRGAGHLCPEHYPAVDFHRSA